MASDREEAGGISGRSGGDETSAEEALQLRRRGRPVEFVSGRARLRGRLFLPESATGRLPAAVVTGSWLSVKEQMPLAYAQRLAARGFAALTFDFRGFGESEGSPAGAERPARKAEDIDAAARFVRTLPEVDPERVALLGVCASAGYAARAAVDGAPVRALALVAPWLHDATIVRQMYGGSDGVLVRLERAEAARALRQRTGEVTYVPAASNTDPAAAMYAPGDLLDYYLNPARGAVPAWTNRFAVESWNDWLRWDPIALAPAVPVPTIVVHSESAAIPEGARRFAAALRVPHQLAWVRAQSQFAFYDDPATIDRALDRATPFLSRTLAPAATSAARA